ncbi:unnamed protein product [Rotaria sp. Silwood1]|nr:unnamed protein product [Rotaria sp. Silwood1]
MSAADVVFNQVDFNRDGRVDLGEFRNFSGQNLGAGVTPYDLGVNQFQYAVDAQGLYQDPNLQVVRRPNLAGFETYTQNVPVNFLQPPAVPFSSPLMIQDVRRPQPPLPPSLRLRQVVPSLPSPLPLGFRERPLVVPSQTRIRRLPGIPVLPSPPQPRNMLERWLPYGPQPEYRTVVQRALPPVAYPTPRNAVVQYGQGPARVVRNFQNLGVVSGSPAAYAQEYGASLLDGASLVAQARSAGVVEDISAPGYVGNGLGVYGQQWNGNLVAGDLGYGGLWRPSAVVSGADAAFLNADTNWNGSLDRQEFRNLLA